MSRYLPVLTLVIGYVYSLNGPNVCTKQESYPIEVKVSANIPYEVHTFGWCLSVIPRCRKTRIAYRIGYRTETRIRSQTIESCCKGYKENNGKCIPNCVDSCIYGHCIAPDTCKCRTGWEGHNCNVSCPKDEWGSKCDIRYDGFSIHIEQDESELNSLSGGLIAVICVTSVLVLLLFAIFIVVYYRRRFGNIRHEMTFVAYTAEAVPDQKHFDNVVHSSISATNKVANFHNNLNNTKNNIEKAKLSSTSDDKNTKSCELNFCSETPNNVYCEIEEMSLKDQNLNTSIYHSIEDFKQIVGKRVGETNGYDHLQYDIPRNDIKHSYKRLDVTTNATNRTKNSSFKASLSQTLK